MKRKILIAAGIVTMLLVICVIVLLYIISHSFGFSVGRCLIATTGEYMFVADNSPTIMSTDNEKMFKNLENGDKILVFHSGVLLTYPGETGVYAVLKLSDGDISDIPQAVLDELTDMGWWEGKDDGQGGNTAPEDFFDTTVSWANYNDRDDLFVEALNADKINERSHLPILKFETLEELGQFKEQYGDVLTMNSSYDEVPSFETSTKSMDEEYFKEYTVLLVYVTAGSGSLRFGVDSLYNDGGKICVYIEQTNNPEAVTMDMAGWFITVSVNKGMVDDNTTFDAELLPVAD